MDWLTFDFETLHNVPWNANVISLACIAGNWDEVTFEAIEKNGIDPLLERGMELFFDLNQKKYNRVVGEETVEWWKKQSPDAQARVFKNTHTKHDLTKLVELFTEYCVKHGVNKNTKVFLRGPDFDHTIMTSIFDELEAKLPYNHWNLRDIRTILDVTVGSSYIYNFNDYCSKKYNLVAHDALHDCMRDIMQTSFALQTDSKLLVEDYSKHGLKLYGW